MEKNLLIPEEKQKSEALFTKHEVLDTPFTVIEKDGTYYKMCGRYKISTHETLEEATKACKKITWNDIINVIAVINEAREEATKRNKQTD